MLVDKDRDLCQPNVEDRRFLKPIASGEATAVPLQSVGAPDCSQGENDALGLKSIHEVLAHINRQSVQKFLELQKIPSDGDLHMFEHCILAKQTRASDHSRKRPNQVR